MSDEIGLSPKQDLSIREARANVNIWEGSVRSGKTIASLLRWMIYVATTNIRGELVVISRTRASAARNVFSPLMDPTLFGDLAQHVAYTPGADTGTILGRRVWVLGSSDVRSENVLRGLTCSGAYVDEVTLLQEDFFVQLLNRRWEGAQIFGTTNPDNPAHWLKRRFLDRLDKLPDWKSWKFFLDDNPMLSEERKAAIRRENVGLYYRRNVLGEWVAAEGAVYPMWDPARHVVPWESLPDMARLFGVGVDYGTQNATVGILLGLGYDRRLYLVDEWRYDKDAHGGIPLSDLELADSFVPWLRAGHTPQVCPQKIEWVVVDPSAASFKAELGRRNVHGIADAENDVVWGLKMVASLLTTGHLLVSDRCEGLITEIPAYSWDDKKAMQGIDAPLKTMDHSLDAMRYIVATTESLWRHELTTEMAA